MKAEWIQIDGPSPPRVLSYSTAKILVQRSPLHAKLKKDRQLDEDTESEREDKETGNIVHAMLLGAGKKIVIVQADSYRTKAAKEARDAAREEGAIPVLEHKERIYSAIARRIQRRIEGFGFTLDGHAEIGARWFEEACDGTAVECMGALDLWQPKTGTIVDLKTCRTAHPDAIRQQVYKLGYDIQAAAYLSAVEKIHPEGAGRVRFVILFCELGTGAVTPVELTGDFLQLGRMRWQRAVDLWARCLREDRWPGYVETTLALAAPEWALVAEQDAQAAEQERAWGLTQDRRQPAGNEAGEEHDDHETDPDLF